jgi:glutamine cyclotransferase
MFKDGKLYESNGQNGSSDLRVLDPDTGKLQSSVKLGDEYFGEGMTILNGKIFQLTWLNNKGFIYDENSLALLGDFPYVGEGWGLTNDGRFLIMSNGTNAITFINPETFQIQKVVYVYDNGVPVTNINELEYVKGEIYANIWHADKIVEIDPQLGEILGWIDLTGLRSKEAEQNDEAVLNGIAYDPATDRLFVTGKLWDTLFEIKLERK